MTKQKTKKVKYKNKKGCWNKIWPSVFTIVIVLIVGVLFFLDQFLSGVDNVQKYVNLLDELDNPPTDEQMAPNMVSTTDQANFQDLINNAVTNNEGNPLFDENGNFIYENILPENVTIPTGTTISLDKTSLACLLNSSLGAGWVSDLYDDGENLLSILQITTLATVDETTTITAVGKLKLGSILDGATEEEKQALKILDAMPDDLYFVYTASFNYSEETLNISSSMWVNQLTAESNELFLELFFGNWVDQGNLTLAENLNSITEWSLSQFNDMLSLWGGTASFSGENIILTKN